MTQQTAGVKRDDRRTTEEETMGRTRITGRALVRGGALAAAGGAAFFGPWRHNRVWAQGKKPIKLGLTCDASGQYGNSGQDDVRGIRLAIDEANARGLENVAAMLRPGGVLVLDTIAKTWLARLVAVTIAERVPGGVMRVLGVIVALKLIAPDRAGDERFRSRSAPLKSSPRWNVRSIPSSKRCAI